MLDNGKVQTVGIGQRDTDSLASPRIVFQHSDSGGFRRAAGRYGRAMLDLSAVFRTGDDFLPRIVAFFKVHAASSMLVEYLSDSGLSGDNGDPCIAAVDFM